MFAIVVLLCLIASALANQTSPGTATRPILSSTEAASYTEAKYLQGWSPETINVTKADYTVGSGFSTIQAAINAAIKAGGTTRKYIRVPAGTYAQVFYIPESDVPITIYGDGNTKTVISLSVSATLTGAQYTAKVGKLFASGDPAFNLYSQCAAKAAIGTSCSAVVWIRSDKVQIANMQIENLSAQQGTDQAVALESNGDMVQLDNLRILSHQDTLYLGTFATSLQRSRVTRCYIAGDIDFVFGGGSSIFLSCVFNVRADRRSDIATVFAPDTHPSKSYGFLVQQCVITGDAAWATSKTVSLARAWDTGVASASDYVAGTSPNGQLVIRQTTINVIVNTAAPYTKATSGRVYKGNAATSRNLNDNTFNRFWEFANTGNGA